MNFHSYGESSSKSVRIITGQSVLIDPSSRPKGTCLEVESGIARVYCPCEETEGMTLAFLQSGDQLRTDLLCSDGVCVEALTDLSFHSNVNIDENVGYDAVNDKYIAVASVADDDDGSGSGAAYIYDLDGNNEVKITTSDAYAGQYFPRTLSLSDDKLVSGVWSDDEVASNAGAVYIFDLDYSIIDNQTGHLVIKNSSSSKKNILLQATSGENSIVCNDNSSV